MGKPTSGSKPKVGGGNAKGSNLGVYVALAVVLGAVVWMSVRPGENKKKAKKPKPVDPTAQLVEDRLKLVKENFFTEDGKPQFDKSQFDANPKEGFASVNFWEERYAKEKKQYDWYGTWNGQKSVRIKEHVAGHLPSGKGPVLVIGCGSSRLAGELLEDGYTSISNVDISSVVIEKMAKMFEGQTGVDFQVMDITNLTFPEGSFDLVFDKGTLDALYTGAAEKVKDAVPEIFKVLRPGGVFVSMTFGAPKTRKELNVTSHEDHKAPPGWRSFHTTRIPKYPPPLEYPDSDASYFHVYVAKK